MPIVNQKSDSFSPFLAAVEAKNYSQALRRACTGTAPQVPQLIEILLSYKEQLHININEQAGPAQRAAIHYAAIKKNQAAYDLLVRHGADDSIPDANGLTAADYLVPADCHP